MEAMNGQNASAFESRSGRIDFNLKKSSNDYSRDRCEHKSIESTIPRKIFVHNKRNDTAFDQEKNEISFRIIQYI